MSRYSANRSPGAHFINLAAAVAAVWNAAVIKRTQTIYRYEEIIGSYLQRRDGKGNFRRSTFGYLAIDDPCVRVCNLATALSYFTKPARTR